MTCVYVLYISNDGTAPGKNIKKSGTSKVNDETRINVLSFDGGGSRGVMEIFILKDVMNMATILKNDLDRFIFPHNKEDCVKLREILRNVKKPIHPTEVFEFIVGTSTGALIAFGLVEGKKSGEKRQPLTVQEIIDMYKRKTANIFFQES